MANEKRKKAEKRILDFFKNLDKSGLNHERWAKILEGMSDEDFDSYMRDIQNGSKTLIAFAPLFKSKGFSVENNLELADKYKVPMFERLSFTGGDTPDYETSQEFLLLDLPIRRQSQNLVKKISVPSDNKTIDYMTYQPTGESKGSSLSQPELNVLDGMSLSNTVEEMIRYRGGDKGGWDAYNASINRLGSVSLKNIAPYTTGVESTKAVKNYFLAAHLQLKD